MKTKVAAKEKETGLIVDKLYQALKMVYTLADFSVVDNELNKWLNNADSVLKEFEETYSTDSKPSED